MTKHYTLETKSATELSEEAGVAEIKSALDALTADVNTKTAPVADLEKRLAAAEAKLARPAIIHKANTDEAKDIEAKALNGFLRNGAASLDDAERKTLNIGTNSAGGYVTAPEFSSQVLSQITLVNPMRQVSNVMSVGSNKLFLPVRTTAPTSGWVTEVGSRSSSEPVFSQVEIDIYEQAVVVPISAQLLEDSFVDLQSFVAKDIALQFARLENNAFLLGDGSGKPTGLLHTPGNYTAVTADPSGSDILSAVIKAFYALPAAYALNGAWLMNRTMQGVIRNAADANGNRNTLWSDSLANGTPAALLGRPVYDAPDMDSLPTATGTKYPIAFGDVSSAYTIADRTGVQIMRDDFTGADNGIVKIRARRRVGGMPTLAESVVLVSSTHS